MQINELNQGEKATYFLNDTVLTIEVNDKSLDIDLAAEQEEEKKTIDICLNEKGNLIRGVDKWYVANITIPAASYSLVDTGEVDDQGNPVYGKVKDPFNIDEVRLDLWALPNFIKANQEEGVVN